MIWGRPNLKLEFGEINEYGSEILECRIYNLPLQNKIGRRLWIHRVVAEEVFAVMEFLRTDTKEIVVPGNHALINRPGTPEPEGACYVSLPSSPISYARFGIALATPERVQSFDSKNPIVLSIGNYTVRGKVGYGERHIPMDKQFIVAENNTIFWLE